MRRLSVVLVVVAAVAMPTFGGMTNQRWDFDSAPATWTNILPETDNNPYGQASMAMSGTGLTYFAIEPRLVGGTDAKMVMTIPNSPVVDGWKWVEVKIGYMDYSGDPAPPQWSWTLDTEPVTKPISSGSQGTSPYTANTFPCEEWTWLFEVAPNPQLETVTLNMAGGPWYVDYVEVNTECVPVPGATLLALLGLGAAGAKLRRFV